MAGAGNQNYQQQPGQLPPGLSAPSAMPPNLSSPSQQGLPPGLSAPSAQPTPNVYGQSANAYQAALGGTANAMAGPNIGAFANPFTSDVINQTMADIGRQQEMASNQLGAAATQAGAFGGSRHGVAMGQMMGDYGRTFANTAANLRNTGFNTALGAAQNQQQIGLQGAGQMGNLANLGFGFGQQIGQQQAQQGAMQQAINQALIDAGRGQYGGFTGSPQNAMNLPLAALGAANMGQNTQTTSRAPGLFNIFSTILGLKG